MKKLLSFIYILVICVLLSCQKERNEELVSSDISTEDSMMSPSVEMTSPNRPVLVNGAPLTEPDKKVIKTADVKMKVASVEKSTLAIENFASQLGGFVTSSNIKSNSNYDTKEVELSSDSVLRINSFIAENTIVLRVPYTNFDSLLSLIIKQKIFLDYRNVHMEDVSLAFLKNTLKIQNELNQERLIQSAIKNSNGKLGDVVRTSEVITNAKNQAIDFHVEKLQMDEKVMLSTITLNIYQSSYVVKEVVPNLNLKYYEPGFFHKLGQSFKYGWQLLLNLVLFLAYIWPLVLLVLGLGYYWFYWRKKGA